MKPALVLGLALAANAMTADQGDNELIVAPSGKFAVKTFPGHIMYDEQADDELLVRPVRPAVLQAADDDELLAIKKPREESKMTEWYKQQLYGGKHHYQVADDELIIAPTDEFGNIKPYPRNIRFDEQADDELLIRPISADDDELLVAPSTLIERVKNYGPYIKFDEDGNEFFAAPTHRLGELGHRVLNDDELATRVGEMIELLEREFAERRRMDDEVDDELIMAPLDGTGMFNRRRFDDLATRKVYDDEADTELMRAPYDRRRRHDDIEGRKVYDDEADSELVMAPLDGTGKYNRRRFDDLATRKVYDDEADSELMMAPYRRRFDDLEGRKVYDDEADSELIRAPTDEFGRIMKFPGHIMYDADEELYSKRPASHEEHPKPKTMRPTLFVNRPNAETVRNDDEFMTRPRPSGPRPSEPHPSESHYNQAPTMSATLFVNRAQPHVMRNDDEGDNELMARPVVRETQNPGPNGVKPTLFVNRAQPQVVRNDDEGDDELAYLGELIKSHHKMDRFRDHELPEIKTRKPANGGFLGL